MRHFLDVGDLTPDELVEVLDLADVPAGPAAGPAPAAAANPFPLAGKGVAMVFEKSSNRTRNSMEMAVVQLGGHPVCLSPDEVGIDTRESAEDVVRTLACYHAVVAARVFDHGRLERMAACDVVPVVNLLSDRAHPMQALADLATIRRCFGGPTHPDGRALRVAYVGDPNNVWRSLAIGCAALGIETTLAAPPGYDPRPDDLALVVAAGGEPVQTHDPVEAVAGAHVVYTDVWTSMGREDERAERLAAFEPYRVDAELLSHAADDAVFMHCLPAHRGEEATDDVLDGAASVVWAQAENRMHVARGLLRFLAES